MTSPTRKRSDRSRKRLTQAEKLEIAERAKQCVRLTETLGANGAACAPLTRSDCILIGKAVRDGWDVPGSKRREIVRQMLAALNSDDDRLARSVMRLMIAMEQANA